MAGTVLTSHLPADLGAAIRAAKARLRGQIGDVAAVFAEAEAAMRAEAAAVAADRAAGRPVWPVVQFGDIGANKGSAGRSSHGASQLAFAQVDSCLFKGAVYLAEMPCLSAADVEPVA